MLSSGTSTMAWQRRILSSYDEYRAGAGCFLFLAQGYASIRALSLNNSSLCGWSVCNSCKSRHSLSQYALICACAFGGQHCMQCGLISMNGRKSRQFSQRNSLFLGCSLYMRPNQEHSLVSSQFSLVFISFGVGITSFPYNSIFFILVSGCSHFLCVLLRLFCCILSSRLWEFLLNGACWTRLNLTLPCTDCMEIPEHSSVALFGLRITTTLQPSFLGWDNCSVFSLRIVLSWLLALRPCVCLK